MRTSAPVRTVGALALCSCMIPASESRAAPITAPPGASSHFGFSVATDGELVVIGDIYLTDGTAGLVGAAIVYRREGATWVEAARLVPPAEMRTRYIQLYGYDVDMDSERIVVTAYTDVNGCEEGVFDCGNGSVFIFRRDGDSWVFEDRFLPASFVDERFAYRAELDEDRILVSAPGASGGGSVYSFRNEGSSWDQEPSITPPPGWPGTCFGCGLQLQGDLAAVGDPGVLQPCGDDVCGRGRVLVYSRLGASWLLDADLARPISQPNGMDGFGRSLALGGDLLVVGETGSSSHLYRQSAGGEWLLETSLLGPDTYSYKNVATDGTSVLIAHVDAQFDQPTSFQVFQKTGSTWNITSTLSSGNFGIVSAGPQTVSYKDGLFVAGGEFPPQHPAANVFAISPQGTPIPAMSAWGAAVLTLLVSIAASVLMLRREHTLPAG